MMSCGEALAHLLARQGVRHVFGIPGVHNLEMYRGLRGAGLVHISPRHEQGAVFMADGYARVARRPGVCFLITGPGATNALTGAAQAFGDSVPLLLIAAGSARADLGRGTGALHEMRDQCAVMAGAAGMAQRVLDPATLEATLAEAFARFTAARPRPAYLEIPVDVLEGPWPGTIPDAAPAPVAAPHPAPGAIAAAAARLSAARRPLIVAGGGAVDAAAPLRTLAERCGAPVVLTSNARGLLAPDHPQLADTALEAPGAAEVLAGCDLILAVGTELGATDFGGGARGLLRAPPRIRIDIDPAQMRDGRAGDVAVVGAAGPALAALAAALAEGAAAAPADPPEDPTDAPTQGPTPQATDAPTEGPAHGPPERPAQPEAQRPAQREAQDPAEDPAEGLPRDPAERPAARPAAGSPGAHADGLAGDLAARLPAGRPEDLAEYLPDALPEGQPEDPPGGLADGLAEGLAEGLADGVAEGLVKGGMRERAGGGFAERAGGVTAAAPDPGWCGRVVAGLGRLAARPTCAEDAAIDAMLAALAAHPAAPVVVGDSTQPVYRGAARHRAPRPLSWFNSATGFGTLGYALPAGIGARIAAPDRAVVVLTGDGGLQFSLAELASARDAGADLLVIVWNNARYREIAVAMDAAAIPPAGVEIAPPDLVPLAAAMGIGHTVVRDAGALVRHLTAETFRGVRLLEVRLPLSTPGGAQP